MALPAQDDFGRSDGGLGANWTTITGMGNPQVKSFQCAAVNAAAGVHGALWSADTFPNDQYAFCTLVALNTANNREIRVGLRLDSAGTNALWYRFIGPMGATAFVRITKIVGGVTTNVATANPTALAVNDIGKGTVIGTALELLVNGVAKISTSDASIPASGSAGLGVQCGAGNADTDALLDNWEGGSLSSTRIYALAALGVG